MVYGCTNVNASNYDLSATIFGFCIYKDGSCEYLGCTDELAFNYDSTANVLDNSCYPVIEGCTYDLLTIM